jgi:hypothetical protein
MNAILESNKVKKIVSPSGEYTCLFDTRKMKFLTRRNLISLMTFIAQEKLNAAAKVLKDQGEVGEIYVLTITKTRAEK